jgi:hypothetical protein
MKRADKQAGGFARAKALTPERRTEIARNAVLKRWANRTDEKKAGLAPASDQVEAVIQNTSVAGVRLPT